MGRININIPNPPQDHQYPYQQPPIYVSPDTIDIIHPPPYEPTNDNPQHNADENHPKFFQQEVYHHHMPPPPPSQPSPIHPTNEVLSQPVMYPPAQMAVPFPPPSPHMAGANTAVNFPPPSSQIARASTFPQTTNKPPFSVTTGVPVAVDLPPNNAYTIITPIANGWRTGLLDCMVDPENAIQTTLCPFVTFGQIAEILDEGATSCGTSGLLFIVLAPTGMPWLLTCMYRAKLRKRYGIPESPAADWVVHLLCGLCGLCQEYRELKSRGIDPSVGWHGNL